MTQAAQYVMGVDSVTGKLRPLYHEWTTCTEDGRAETRCGKSIRVVMQSSVEPGTDEMCAGCWRAVRG